ncbi:MAG: sulfate adenylyltransferase [Campylobacterota bacterium]|nr:sulfate adenylyltransferase [Campylobacterota bacterium]
MASANKNNRQLFIDEEAVSALALLKAGLLAPCVKLMNEEESLSVFKTGFINKTRFPFPFVLAPSGKMNEIVLKESNAGDTIDLYCKKSYVGSIVVETVFKIDKNDRVKQIYGSDDKYHPGVQSTLKRLGSYAVSGEYEIDTSKLERIKKRVVDAAEINCAKTISGIMLAANPFHRAHERVIRQRLDKTDLLVIFLLKPFNSENLSYDLRYETLNYFNKHFLPKNRVIIVELEHTYLFAGYKEIIIDALVAKNFGCDSLLIGQTHAGMGMYYEQNSTNSLQELIKGIDINIDIAGKFVYCDECKTLVSVKTCPHGTHHHISYNSESILELIELGIMPPAVLMRKEISSILLSRLHKDRFKNLDKMFQDVFPSSGLIENYSEEDFYNSLMKLYQTTSLT